MGWGQSGRDASRRRNAGRSRFQLAPVAPACSVSGRGGGCGGGGGGGAVSGMG